MAGPRLEVSKFALYVFMPIGVMTFFGSSYFYSKFVEKDYFDFNPVPRNNVAGSMEGAEKQRLAFEEARAKKIALKKQQQASQQE
ncbi:hypothetical protein BB561_004179 [Smittium simulii]|uniref:Uncharacterized protein n=1 Tax=Smittium simulii TaxID=133385 RepID=A0A2T9YHN0_9FUNG|nr:hypothetical protein BB561_004179 [Smittium simulii]